MSDRWGLGRLDSLQEDDPQRSYSIGGGPPVARPLYEHMDPREVQIQVARAVIEELHEALKKLSNPGIIITHPIDKPPP